MVQIHPFGASKTKAKKGSTHRSLIYRSMSCHTLSTSHSRKLHLYLINQIFASYRLFIPHAREIAELRLLFYKKSCIKYSFYLRSWAEMCSTKALESPLTTAPSFLPLLLPSPTSCFTLCMHLNGSTQSFPSTLYPSILLLCPNPWVWGWEMVTMGNCIPWGRYPLTSSLLASYIHKSWQFSQYFWSNDKY